MKILLMAVMLVALVVPGAGANTISLDMFLSAYNRDGTVTQTTPAFTLSQNFNSAGTHYSAFYVDVEIDQADNTWFNEYGQVVGTPLTGQSWEIDEPGFMFGDIYANFSVGSLDEMIFDGAFDGPEDVAMALAWDFTLAAGQAATAVYTVSLQQPASGFYLVQYDPDSAATLYFSSTLTIGEDGGGGGNVIPEPSTFVLFGTALAGLGLYVRKRKNG